MLQRISLSLGTSDNKGNIEPYVVLSRSTSNKVNLQSNSQIHEELKVSYVLLIQEFLMDCPDSISLETQSLKRKVTVLRQQLLLS